MLSLTKSYNEFEPRWAHPHLGSNCQKFHINPLTLCCRTSHCALFKLNQKMNLLRIKIATLISIDLCRAIQRASVNETVLRHKTESVQVTRQIMDNNDNTSHINAKHEFCNVLQHPTIKTPWLLRLNQKR